MAISFIADDEDNKILQSVQERFEVTVTDLPEEIDISTYSKSPDILFYINYSFSTIYINYLFY